jgi:hypothetical protein
LISDFRFLIADFRLRLFCGRALGKTVKTDNGTLKFEIGNTSGAAASGIARSLCTQLALLPLLLLYSPVDIPLG